MGGLLTVGQLAVLFGFVGFVLGAFAGPKLKDWYNGIPAPVRAQMTKLEAGLQSKLAIELNSAMSRLHVAAGLPNPVVVPPPSPVVLPPAGVTGPVGP